ncbi:MAG TPA: glycine--tRNA ligase subunit beta [Stellaceae bacterium]|nr:glycine--tRNA ligase subunit beta [Stellaceae bacterium]
MSGELLLELLSEEIPAGMQRRAIEQLTGLVRDKLAGADVAAARIAGHVTPRRLVVIADGIPARQPDRSEERRGPRVGAPPQAIDGFLRAAGLASIDDCEVRSTDRGEFYFAVTRQPGRATAEVLPELLLAAMTALTWPKSMRYPASGLRWVRPLNSVVCLFDGAVLDLPLGAVPVGRVTRGHRFLAPDEISVANAAEYRDKLAKAHVVLDWNERRQIIARDLDKLAEAERLKLKPDDALLDEVTGLVEWPVVLMGRIDADFVRPLPDGLPPEVLATAMRTHQKYFSCLNPDGTPAPRFLFVANNATPDGGKTVAAGNERVLRARLSDARFFWDQDRKTRLEDRVEALKQRVYHEKLGSVYDKVERMKRLAELLLTPVPGSGAANVRQATQLSKADLSTGMIGEFPELQGIMGRYYALHDGKSAVIADAIADHYRPLGPNDVCPTAPASVVVALADKIDALTAFFAIGEPPTGSRDPFALRRAALGVIRIILENDLRIGLKPLFKAAAQPFQTNTDKAANAVLGFVADRLKVHLREQGVRHDLISAVFALNEDDLVRLLARVSALQAFIDSDDGANLLTAYRRASNIVSIEERRDDRRYDHAPDKALYREQEEYALASDLEVTGGNAGHSLSSEEFPAAMGHLASMRRYVDEFFAKVTVNADDPKLRENRLRLLARIRATMNQVADFSQIEG